LIGEPLGDYRALLVARLPRDRRAAVEFHDCVPPAQLPSLLAAHDIGLALEDRSILNRDLTITNKILQYLNAGLAVVATNTAGQREVLAHAPEVGVLVSPDDPANYAAALDRLLSERDRLAARQRAARRLAEQIYCWEREAPRLVALVERALATG
jgi:glycosyltransferase involved in cell wall biosynthesis